MGTAKEQDYLSGSSLPHSSPVLADLIFWYNQPQRSGIFKFFFAFRRPQRMQQNDVGVRTR